MASRPDAARASRAAGPASHRLRTAGGAAMAICLCAAALTAPRQASGYAVATASVGGKAIKRWYDTTVYYLLSPLGSDDVPFASVKAEIEKGVAAWASPSCTSLQFKPGYHCNTALGKCLYDKNASCTQDIDCPAAKTKKVMPLGFNNNGRTELVFAEDSTWKHGSYVLGVTVALDANSQGAITESDIAFNGLLQKWTLDPNKAGNGTQHLLSVAIHEQGHWIGVQHMLGGWSQSDPPTMTPNVMPLGISATLSPDDLKAPCFLNPKSGKYACTNDSDCPFIVDKSSQSGAEAYTAKLVCQSGQCIFGPPPAQKTKVLGEVCTSDSDCKSGLFCQPIGNGTSYCAQNCSVSKANCPSGFQCYGYQSGGDQGVCLKPLGGSQKDLDASCSSSGECKSLLCVGGKCKQACAVGGTSCPPGQVCEQVPGQGGACVPKTGPTLAGLGDECSAPEECESGLCMKDTPDDVIGHCRTACTVPGSCPTGFKCDSQAIGYTGCIPGKEEVESGQPCINDGMCKGGLCVPAAEQGKVCSNPCTLGAADACPCGMMCAVGVQGTACYVTEPVGCLKDGTPCSGDGACASGICLSAICRPACTVGDEASCDAGLACLSLQGSGGKGRCVVPGQTGEGSFCVSHDVCASLLCLSGADAVPRCQDPCLPDQPTTCDAGEICVAMGAGHGCVTDSGGAAETSADAAGGSDSEGSDGGGGGPAEDGVGVQDTAAGVFFGPPAPASSCSAAPVSRASGSNAAAFGLLGLAALLVLRRGGSRIG